MQYRGDTIEKRDQIGWQLVPMFRPPDEWDVAKGAIECCVCSAVISETGGPRIGAYCFGCAPQNERT